MLICPSDSDITVSDRRSLHAFAAFMEYAGPPGERQVVVHPEWHAWLTGKGPCPDPDSQVGP